ncbi:Prion-inhibition and propagation domain containing protein [Rhypophila decipiens]
MAEAVGVSLAILGLAGNLKECLDLFAYLSSARDFGRDYSTLASKFDIEKALLLQWAERVRILRADYDPRLNDETTLGLVSGILANIKHLLADGAELQRKYGLKSVDVSPDSPQGLLGDGSATGPPGDLLISNSMMRRFTKDFQSLLNNLAHFVSKLNQIVPDRGAPSSIGEFGDGLAQKLYQLMTDSSRCVFHMAAVPEGPPQITQLAQLRMARDAARQDQGSSILSDVADRILIQKAESIIVDAIWFRSLQARRDSIEPALLKTLEWVLDSTRDTGEWDNLATWLKSDSGVYWVSGKAGSGKSTLMKHVHNHPTTLDLLERWASGDSLLVGSFFFWGLGSNEQKSHRGLSRSLLYHIIERHPFLVPKLFPEIWREVYIKNERNLQDLAPNDADLKGAFTALPTILAEQGIKICLFIDGLDEFEGNLRIAIQMILEMGQSPNIKVVVSSRPEPACVSLFSTLKKLRLQDLNRPDIQEYVDSQVGANPYMQELRKDDDAGCARLLEDLADRASGVFLWIILACRSLLDGFDSTDSLCELRHRLEELPRELADMFQHILNKVPTAYHKQTAQLLKLAERCQVAPWHADDPHRNGMPALTLSIMEHAEFCPESASFDHMSISEKKTACEKIEGRVRSRTGGLLELVYLDSLGALFWPQDELELETLSFSDMETARKKINSFVRFMHRTVFEFLHDSAVWETINALQLATNKAGFDPESVLAAMSTGRVHFTMRKRPRSEDDGPDSKRRRYNDDEDVEEEGEDDDEYDYTDGENVDND